VVTNDFPLFNIVENRLSPAYLGWMCRTASFVDECKQASEGTTNRVRLQEDKFLAREIPLPPLSEQRRMVARIEELATQINEARALRQQAAEEAKALLSSAQSGLTQSKAANKLMVSELLSEGGLRNGRSVKSTGIESEIRCLVLSALRNGRINIEDSKPVPILPSDAIPFQVQSGDVYVIRGNGSKDLCGRAGLACEGSERVIFPDLFIKVPLLKEKILPEYFVAAWNSSYTRTFIEEKAKTTSGIWKINQGHILSTPIPVPTIPEQRNIVVELDGLQAEVDALKRLQSETSAELDALLPSILDRAFKGEL
jgi:type I restriction enzyme S subunit